MIRRKTTMFIWIFSLIAFSSSQVYAFGHVKPKLVNFNKSLRYNINSPNERVILTDSSPDKKVASGSFVYIYGSAGTNKITLESGAGAKLINFPGNNIITIESDSGCFTVSRSGATVTFKNSKDQTLLILPATKSEQNIIFNDNSFKLVISGGSVALDSQIIGLEPSYLEKSGDACLDFTVNIGEKDGTAIKPLNGINAGPVPVGEEENADLTTQYKELGIKYVRTHDFYGPFDMSQIYKDRTQDPLNSGSYYFEDTDKYYEGIIGADAAAYFRLGDSYNNSVPPESSELNNWVEASMNVIAHYYEGKWSGYNGNFEYVEIWNEPDNSQFWPDKTLLDFCILFDTTAKKLRERFPNLKIGGPGFTQGVNLRDGGKQILRDFLSYIKSKNTPIDFISFHQYVNEPSEITTAVNSMKDILKEKGFEGLPMHLTEWNTDAEQKEQPAGEKAELRINSKGAAINTGTWIAMQNNGIDMAFFFRGDDTNIDNPAFYGLYKADGNPKKSAYAFKFFNDMSKYEDRLSASTTIPEGSSGDISSSGLSSQIYVIAGEKKEDGTRTVLISNLSDKPYKYCLKEIGTGAYGDASQNIDGSDVVSACGISDEQSTIYNIGSGGYFELPAYGVQMISIKKP